MSMLSMIGYWMIDLTLCVQKTVILRLFSQTLHLFQIVFYHLEVTIMELGSGLSMNPTVFL